MSKVLLEGQKKYQQDKAKVINPKSIKGLGLLEGVKLSKRGGDNLQS